MGQVPGRTPRDREREGAGAPRHAAKFGATDAIDPAQPLTPQVEKIAGRGADIIFECVGAPGLIGSAMMEAPRGARIVIAGVCQQPDTIMPLIGIMKEINLQSCSVTVRPISTTSSR